MGIDHDNNSGPLSWRDVYRAVSESEDRVIAAIKDAIAPLTASAADHEARLRVVEIQTRAMSDQRAGVVSALTAGQKTVLLLTALIAAGVAVIDLVSRLHP